MYKGMGIICPNIVPKLSWHNKYGPSKCQSRRSYLFLFLALKYEKCFPCLVGSHSTHKHTDTILTMTFACLGQRYGLKSGPWTL